MEENAVFRRTSTFACTADALFAFHERADVFALLTPPGSFLQVLEDARPRNPSGTCGLTSGTLRFRLWLGPIPVIWCARHQPGPIARAFVDVQEAGPLAFWEHTHRVDEAPEKDGISQATLTDSIVFRHHPGARGLLTQVAFGDAALSFLFAHRHRVTRRIVESSR